MQDIEKILRFIDECGNGFLHTAVGYVSFEAQIGSVQVKITKYGPREETFKLILDQLAAFGPAFQPARLADYTTSSVPF
jgi:hypothetical protein